MKTISTFLLLFPLFLFAQRYSPEQLERHLRGEPPVLADMDVHFNPSVFRHPEQFICQRYSDSTRTIKKAIAELEEQLAAVQYDSLADTTAVYRELFSATFEKVFHPGQREPERWLCAVREEQLFSVKEMKKKYAGSVWHYEYRSYDGGRYVVIYSGFSRVGNSTWHYTSAHYFRKE